MVAPRGSVALVLERCHRNYVETLWQYVRSAPGATRRDLSDCTLIRSNMPSSVADVLFIPNPTTSPRERILEAWRFFGPKLPWRVQASGDRATEVGKAATSLGLRPSHNDPGMLLDPIPAIPQAPTSLEIRPVTDERTLADFGAVWSEVFQIPRWVLPVALHQPLPADPERGAQNRFLVGYVEGRPAACSTVTVTERVAGIASVGSISDVRGKGIGTAMTWAAVGAGRAFGAEVSFLAATAMGYPVYERMGYRRVAEYPCWQTPFGFFRMLGAARTLRRLVRMEQVARPSPAANASRP